MNRKSGQFICYKTGQFYLLLTNNHYHIDTQYHSSYSLNMKRQYFINYSWISAIFAVLILYGNLDDASCPSLFNNRNG